MRTRADRRGAPDEGFSFVETVVTIVLLGLVVVPVLGAVRGSIQASAINRAAAQVETALVNAAEAVSRMPMRCSDAAYVVELQGVVEPLPGDITVVDVTVDRAAGTTWNDDPCPGATPTFDTVQRVVIRVAGLGSKVERTIEVLKTHV